jgi:hypothetical protein
VSPFATYFLGFLVLIAGLCFAAYLLNVPPLWIAAGAVIMLGVAIMLASKRPRTSTTTHTPPPPPPGPGTGTGPGTGPRAY